MMSVLLGGKLIPTLKRTPDNTGGHNYSRGPDLESTAFAIGRYQLHCRPVAAYRAGTAMAVPLLWGT